jgi:phosphonate transport system substrate-binding protein
VNIELHTPKDFQSFWREVKKRRYDIVHFNQYHYVKSHKEYNYDVILKNVEFGEATIAGAIVVRKDTNINKVTDLRNRTVVFGGGPKAMQSYIVAKYLLQKNGLADNEYKTSFAKNPPNAIISTYLKQSDAAGSGDKVLRLKVVKKEIDVSKMKILVQGEQLAHLPWAVKSELPKVLKNKIQKLMSQLDRSRNGQVILKKMRLDGLQVSSDEEYDPHRKIIKQVLGENY